MSDESRGPVLQGASMELIEPEEMERYVHILNAHHCSVEDFELHEVDTTDLMSDELLPIKGFLHVLCRSTARWKEYPIGDGTAWISAFDRDFQAGKFSETRAGLA